MRIAVVLAVAVCAAFLQNCARETAATQPDPPTDSQAPPIAAEKRPVLVELFTSEGCSSCPPADRALTLLEKQQPVSRADVVTLEFHVDYWDGPGWKDPFSSAAFTQRQEQYASAFRLDSDYTPQMIVDGQAEFVGSDLAKATSTIEELGSTAKGKIDARISSDSLKIAISDLRATDQATVYFAAVEDNLTSNVTGGENSGEKLYHTSVVHDLQVAGTIEKGTEQTELTQPLRSCPKCTNDKIRYVVFVQENKTRKILAVGRAAKL